MAPPSALHIATQSVKRLVKEEVSYHKELAGQQARVNKLKTDIQAGSPDLDENAEYVLKQEVSAIPSSPRTTPELLESEL
jgi:tubulin-specific chaperone A